LPNAEWSGHDVIDESCTKKFGNEPQGGLNVKSTNSNGSGVPYITVRTLQRLKETLNHQEKALKSLEADWLRKITPARCSIHSGRFTALDASWLNRDMDESSGYEQEWKELRHKRLGAILQMKLAPRSAAQKEFAEMELERRAFVRDVLIDRILSVCAIVVSVIALLVRSHWLNCEKSTRTARFTTHGALWLNAPITEPHQPSRFDPHG
jgi:hypothetical protein